MTSRILLVDEHTLFRAGVSRLLEAEPGLEVAGEAETGEEALELADALRPDVVLMAIRIPGCGGIEATRRLTERHPRMRVLIVTGETDRALARHALEAGASGFLQKRASATDLMNAIHTVAQGGMFLDPAMVLKWLRDNPMETPPGGGHEAVGLTPRQVEVLQLIAEGYTSAQIAERLVISLRTVEYHRHNLSDRLRLRRRVDIVHYAIAHGLLDHDGHHPD